MEALITVTSGHLMHMEELELMLALQSPNIVEMVSKIKMQRLRLYICIPSAERLSRLRPALAASFPSVRFANHSLITYLSIQCRRQNSVILDQGSSLLLRLLWYVATFCLLRRLTCLFNHTSYNAKDQGQQMPKRET